MKRALLDELSESLAPAINLLAAIGVERYDDATTPDALHGESLLPGAASVIVMGSGGRSLWAGLESWIAEAPRARLLDEEHPLDRYVAMLLARGEALLTARGLRWRRFEPTVSFTPRLNFRRLGELAGFGSPSPIGLIVHPIFGPWWALRGAWFVDGELPAAATLARPCDGCPAPCRSSIPPGTEGTLYAATLAARQACPISVHRYCDEQIDYHYRPEVGRARLIARLAGARP